MRQTSPRLGGVKYLNARPLIDGWPGELVLDHPSTLCRQLAAGELDGALVSSFEYLRNPIYTIVDGVAIGSDGPVYSVYVAHRRALEDTAEIALDPASSTSVNLLRCLLARAGLQPRLLGEKAGDEHARLLIGDQAIRFRLAADSGWQFWDLGREWQKQNGLPFVYALWLLRPDFEHAAALAHELRALRERNLRRLPEIAAAAREYPRKFCREYLEQNLSYAFADPEKEGLKKFQTLCENECLLQPSVSPWRFV